MVKAVFEVDARNGLARTGLWNIQDSRVRTPAILFATSARIPHPEQAEVLLGEETHPSLPTILCGDNSQILPEGNIPGPDAADGFTTYRKFCYPPSLEELNKELPEVSLSSDKIRIFHGTENFESQLSGNAEVCVLTDAPVLYGQPRKFARAVLNLRKAAGPQRLLYVPGVATPARLAHLAYLGVDIIDSIQLVTKARQGLFLSRDGETPSRDAGINFCFCPACQSGKGGFETILFHNYYATLSELSAVRRSIRGQKLRIHVEGRIHAEPSLVAGLRVLDCEHFCRLEASTPITGPEFSANLKEALSRPDIVRWRNRMAERYKKPESPPVLLLLPCSARKPYSKSKTHRIFSGAVRACGNWSAVHEVIVTSPLGLVPRELERFYPAAHYDIPVTGVWDAAEREMIESALSSYLETNNYGAVVSHLGDDLKFLENVAGDARWTCAGSPTGPESLQNLTSTLTELAGNLPNISKSRRMAEIVRNMLRFQFGDAGRQLAKDVEVRGRYPVLKLFRKGQQLGMYVPERGLFSLTIAGGEVLSDAGAFRVEIEDFKPKGSIFAVGVTGADSNIRPGDEVVVVHKGDVRGVGTAVMPPEEMALSSRGEAVKLRHHS